jgi:hypothetical protein
MIDIKEGIKFHAKLIYSNRFGNQINITGGDLDDRTVTFDLTEEAEKILSAAHSAQEIDSAILKLYGGRK